MITSNGLTLELGKHQKDIDFRLKQLQHQNFSERLWNKDESLWPLNKNFAEQTKISEIPLGWLNVVSTMLNEVSALEEFSQSIRNEGFEHAVLLGMGGSSLAPYVFQQTFQSSANRIKLTILDTTDPKTILKAEREINIPKTLFIVSSKSGNTCEVKALYSYFYERVFQLKQENAGENFIAITDESSPLAELASQKKFRKLFINFSDIGGRFSALSYFGLVPAALIGINVKELLQRTNAMIKACGPLVPAAENPGLILGAALAELALENCDKLTYMVPKKLEAFGLWLEQLIAESTGKNGTGILPLNGNPIAEINTYGKDRVFLQIGFSGKQDDANAKKIQEIISIKFPFINIQIENELDLGQEFFRWEIATAVAGAILNVNPFDQPNVEESKICTGQFLKKLAMKGKLPETKPSLTEGNVNYYAAEKTTTATSLLEDFFCSTSAGDYVVFHSYLPEEPETVNCFTELQLLIQKHLRLAASTQFGPRYLHSTGQYHKGGPNNGFFIQFICEADEDIQIPGYDYTFSALKKAQAMGDMEALKKQKRKVILVDVGKNLIGGLDSFRQSLEKLQPPEKKSRKAVFAYAAEKNTEADGEALSNDRLQKFTFLF